MSNKEPQPQPDTVKVVEVEKKPRFRKPSLPSKHAVANGVTLALAGVASLLVIDDKLAERNKRKKELDTLDTEAPAKASTKKDS